MENHNHKPTQPVHVAGIHRGESAAIHKGKEAGRGEGKQYRSSRDSTGINAADRQPIIPGMPSIPPA